MTEKKKAVFIDHMGTLVSDHSEYVKQAIYQCYKSGKFSSPQEAAGCWFKRYDMLMEKYQGADFKTEYEISRETFETVMKDYAFQADVTALCGLLEKHWTRSPAFEDTGYFFDNCPVPIYIVTNNDSKYIKEGVRNLGINPAGIVTSEMARAYKPQKEIFLNALKKSGYQAKEVVHIGDSPVSDVQGAQAAGIEPWLLDRENVKKAEGVKIIHSLRKAVEELKNQEG